MKTFTAARRTGLRSGLTWLLAAANIDFCPWANRYVAWLKQPIGWFVIGIAASALVGGFLAPQGWLAGGTLSGVVILGLFWPRLAMGGITAELSFARPRGGEGEAAEAILTIHNRRPWPVWGLLVESGFWPQQDSSPDAAGRPRDVTALARVPGWSRTRFRFTFEPPRRGLYPAEPPRLTTGFPFGLGWRSRPIAVAAPLIVWPRCEPPAMLPRCTGQRPAAGGVCIDRAGDDLDILSARPYRPGDPLRRIHWQHSARRDELFLCERQSHVRWSVRIVLDGAAFAASHQDAAALTELDRAVRLVAGFCRELHRRECDLSCDLDGQILRVPSTRLGWQKLMDRLAVYEPAAAALGHSRQPAARTDSRAGEQVIVVTRGAGSEGPAARVYFAEKKSALQRERTS